MRQTIACLCAVLAGIASAKVVEPSIAGWCLNNAQSPLRHSVRSTCPMPIWAKNPMPQGKSAFTHPIACVSNGTRNREGNDVPHCTYTNAFFGNGHGTSIITLPHVISDVVAADALEDRPSYGGSGQRVWASGPIVNATTGPAYEVKPSPGKGLGVFALRRIRQGEILMLDFPALLVGKQFLEDIKPVPRRRVLRKAISQLPEKTQKKIYSLARSVGGQDIDDILGTNTCSVVLGDATHLGLYPEVSRINHACNPNSFYRFSPRTLAIEVVAYRDILPGEEVTISYAHLTLSRTARREFLKENYHFDCTCSLCRAASTPMTESEDRRRDIRKNQSLLQEATMDRDYLSAIGAAQELIRLTAEEGVTPVMAELWDMLAAIHLDMRDWTSARRYGRLALEGWEAFDSVDSYQLDQARWFMGYIENVKAEYEKLAADSTWAYG